jgi:outer membrane autotransporter protein
MLAPNLAHAQDATWTGSASGNWSDNFNWAPAVPAGTATFDNTALTTSLTFSSFTEIGTLQFATTAPAYFYDLSGRALVIGGAGILNSSSSAPTFNAFGLLEFDNAATAGNAIINNTPGATTFTGTSTAGTATITNSFGGLLSFTDSSTAGGASITTNSGSQTRFSANSTAGNATIIANSGALTQFFDNSTAANATISNNGVLNFFDASTAGNAAIANLAASNIVNFFNSSTAGNASITNNGFLGFSDTSTAGNASITNTFFVGFSNASSAGTATITNNLAGTLAFGDSSTAANATITMNNGGRVVFTQDSTGGQARFITNGGGVFDMSGLTGAGMTAGSIEGAGSYALGSKQLTVGGNNLSTQVSGIIADGGTFGGTGGSLVKVGAGTLTLSGVNTYTGATTVNAGTLSVNGSIANSSVTVNAGGMLGGNGTIGNTTINGGTLSPGNSIGTLTVQGNLVLTSASAYIVEVSPTAADRTNVTGTASLAGTVQAVFGPGAYITRTYTILSAADGSTGTFGSLTTTGLPAGFTASLSYTATDAILNLTATLGQQQIGTGGLSTNQRNVATSLNTFFNNGGTLPPGFVSVFAQTGGNLGNALSQLSGEAATGGQQVAFQMTNQFLGLMLDPFVDGRTGAAGLSGPAIGFAPEREAVPNEVALAYAAVLKAPPVQAPSFEQRWSAWGGAYGGGNRTSGDPAVLGSHDLTASTAGFAGGLDYRVTPDTVVGVALAGGGTSWSLANGLGGGKSDAFQAGAYGATRWGAAYVAAALSYTHHWMSTDRFAFASEHLTASFNAQSIGARVESGYRFATLFGGLTPYAAVQAQNFRTPSYSETNVNGGGFGLAYNGRTGSDTRSELGARFDRLLALNPNAVLTLRARLAWAHDWVSDPVLAAAFQTLPGASFIVNGATPAKNSALASAGTELRLANGVTLLGKFDGEFASRSTTYAGTGTIRYSW